MTRTINMSQTLPLERSAPLAESQGFIHSMVVTIAVRALILSLGIISITTAAGRINGDNASGHAWVAWDGDHYLSLIENGYPASAAAERFYDIAYFPVYPLAVRAICAITPLQPALAMVVLSNLCAVIGFGLLYLWAERLSGQRTATIATLLAATYPGAVFFCGGLTEGPFLMMISGTLLLLYYDKFWWAAAVAAVATGLRPTAIALSFIVPFYAWMRLPEVPLRRRAMIFIALGFLSILGAMIYQIFIWYRYQMFDAYFQAQRSWEVGDALRLQVQAVRDVPRYSLEFFTTRIVQPQAWNRVMALIILAITVVGFTKVRQMPRLFLMLPLIIFLMTYIPNNGLRASSIVRYEAPAIPFFLLLAMWMTERRWRYVLLSLIGAQLCVQAYYAVAFSRGHWCG